MPQNTPYPGESFEEFRQRMQQQQGNIDPLAYGTIRPPEQPQQPQIMMRGEPNAAGVSTYQPAPDSQFLRTTQDALAGGGATTHPLNPQQGDGGGRDPNAPFMPSNLNPNRPFFGEAGMPADFSLTGETPQQNPFDIPGVTVASAPQDATTGAQEQAPFTQGGMVADALGNQRLGETAWASLGLLGDRIANWWQGDQPQPEGPPTPPPEGTPFGGPADAGEDAAAGGTGAPVGSQADQRAFEMYSPLPARGEDMISTEGMPQLGREQVEEFIGQMEQTAPGEFQREDVDGSRVLASMGQALAGAGQAPTAGEALLSLGTGGTSAVAQHEQEQRQLRREHEQNQREFQRQLAEQAFAGEQALLESEQNARRFDLQVDQALSQADARRMEALSQRSNIDVSGDNIVVTKPVMDDEGNPTNKTRTEVINTKQQNAFLDAASMSGDGSDISLPEVGGFDPATVLAGSPVDAQADIITSSKLVAGGIPLSRIQEPQVQQRIQQIRQQAEQKVIKQYAGDQEVESVGQLASMGSVDMADIQDEVERQQWNMVMEEMGRNPLVRYGIWQASGNPQLRRIADPALQQIREQYDNGNQ